MIYLFSNTTLQNHKFLVVNNKVGLGERKSKDANKCKQIKKVILFSRTISLN